MLVAGQESCPGAHECVWLCQLLYGYFEKHIGKSQQEPDFCVFNVLALLQLKTEIKGKQHHYTAGFSVWLQPAFCFSSSCLPSLVKKRCELGTTWSKYEAWMQHFQATFTGKCFHQDILVGWEHMYLLFWDTEHSLVDDFEVCLPSVGGEEGREMDSNRKAVVPLSHK